jgi:hypothetical protein
MNFTLGVSPPKASPEQGEECSVASAPALGNTPLTDHAMRVASVGTPDRLFVVETNSDFKNANKRKTKNKSASETRFNTNSVEVPSNDKMALRNDYRTRMRNQKAHAASRKTPDEVKKTEKRKKKREKIVPHSNQEVSGGSTAPPNKNFNFNFPETFKFLSKSLEDYENISPETIVSILETLFSTSIFVSSDNRILKLFLAALEYGKVHAGSSMCMYVYEYVKKNIAQFQFLRDWTCEKFVEFLKSALLDWESLKSNEGIQALFSLMTYIVTLGFVDGESISLDYGRFEFIRFEALKQQVAAKDMVDALWKTLIYVIESAKALATGDFRKLINFDSEVASFEEVTFRLKKQFDFVVAGNMSLADTDEHTFEKELIDALEKGNRLRRICKGNVLARIMLYYKDLQTMHAKFIQVRVSGDLREAPYSYLICGPSSIGKSTLGSFLMRYILEVNGFDHSSKFLCTVNANDKFYPTYKSYVLGVFFDDFANTTPAFCEASPCNTLLEFVNNVALYLMQAEVEMKGKVTAQPKVVGVTTNVPDLSASAYSQEPASIVRRIAEHIHVTVKPEFVKDAFNDAGDRRSELDPAKVCAAYPNWGNPNADFAEIPDIWNINIINVEITPALELEGHTKGKNKGDPWQLVPARLNGVEMLGINIKTLQLYVRTKSEQFYEQQKKLVSNDKKMNANHVCQVCKYHVTSCECEVPSVKEKFISPHKGKSPERVVKNSPWVDYVYQTSREEFHTDLQGFLTSWVFEGKIQANKMRRALELHTSHAFIVLLEKFRDALHLYARKHYLNEVTMWIPQWVENSKLGTYLNMYYRKSSINSIVAANTCGNMLKLICGQILPFLYFKPLAALPICIASTRLIPEDIFSRLMIFTAKKATIDSERLLRSLANFWVKELIRIPMRSHWMFGSKSGVQKVRMIIRLLEVLKRYYVVCQKRLDFVRSRPEFSVALQAFLGYAYPKLSTAVAVGYSVSYFFDRYRKGYREADEALKIVWDRVKACYPSVLRDVVVPSFFSGAMTYVGVPWLCSSITKANRDFDVIQHSALNPTPEEINAKDASDSSTRFAPKFEERIKDPIPVSVSRRSGEVANLVMKNLCHVRREDQTVTNGIFLKSGFLLVPHHMMHERYTHFTLTRKANPAGLCGNAQIKCLISPRDWIRVGEHDLVVAYVPNSGDMKTLVDVFAPRTPHAPRTGKLFYRDRDGILQIHGVNNIVSCITSNNHCVDGMRIQFPGISYQWAGNAEGMCMSPIIADDHKSYIAGVHLGGNGILEARGGSPTPGELKETIAKLCERAHIHNIAQEGDFIVKQYGIDLFDDKLHPRSPLVMLQGSRNYRVYGTTIGRSTASSAVIDTPICRSARKLLNITDSWQSPRFRGPNKQSPWLPWKASLESSTDPSIGFDGRSLEKACDDYMYEIKCFILSNHEFWKGDVTPLTDDQVINGKPQTRFVDGIKKSTAVGVPLTGAKSIYMEFVPDPKGIYQDYAVLDPMFWKDAKLMEKTYLRGERNYAMFKSSLKDEPTLSTKDGVRVFQAAQMRCQLVVRKLYLPIARFLSLNPLLSECAVGINPASREWDELSRHISKYGHGRILAIDYKKYDLRMPAQLTFAAFKILQNIGRLCGYSDEDIQIMEGVATDICWPMCAYNGDLLMLIGSNPSGHNLTVYINGIVNSLLHRMGFFYLYPYERKTFRQCASLITYGDDAAGSVDWWHSKYDMIALRDYFAAHDIHITMAEKDAEFVKHITLAECDFLKRRFVYDAEFNSIIAPISERSIYKSLCSILKSKEISPLEVSACNLCSAADEYFFHGRRVFQHKIVILRQIARDHDICHMTKPLEIDFDERLVKWRAQNPL